MEVNNINGENSGRNDLAELIARVFPAYRSFARRVWDFDSPLPSGPYPKDTLTYRGNVIVEYITPARTEGLGNFNSWLGKNDLPIAGAAILLLDSKSPVDNIPHLVVLSVRFPLDFERLEPAILRNAEQAYSYRSASIGSSRDARMAGSRPETRPTSSSIIVDVSTAKRDTER